MKKFFTLLVLAACCAAMTWGCSDDKYDDTEIRQEIENLKQEIASMKEQVKAIVERSLELVGMAAFAGKTMDRMSDGECQRVMIARALAQDTPIILLDEPTSFLDLPNRYELCTLLRRLAHDHRKCILFSTHELDIALSLCDSIALIDPPVLRYLPTPDMACSGYIERLFSNSFVTFDTESGTIKVRK